VQDVERFFVVAGTSVGVGDDEVLSARVMNQSLVGVELGKFVSDHRIVRAETLDLLVHRNGFEVEFLRAVVFGDAFETGDGFFFFSGANVKVAEHVQGCEIVCVVIDDLPILLDCCVNLSLRQEFLSGF
jgi:hypothetical protein